jgi:hypothetical protein
METIRQWEEVVIRTSPPAADRFGHSDGLRLP